MDVKAEIKKILDIYVSNPRDYSLGWKAIGLDLSGIVVKNPASFSENLKTGLEYLSLAINGPICAKCNDDKSFKWLDEYADYMINGGEEPIFPMSCWHNED
jgi:hypothetical protein